MSPVLPSEPSLDDRLVELANPNEIVNIDGQDYWQNRGAIVIGGISLRPLVDEIAVRDKFATSNERRYELSSTRKNSGFGIELERPERCQAWEVEIVNAILDEANQHLSKIKILDLIAGHILVRRRLYDSTSVINDIPHIDGEEGVNLVSAYPHSTWFLKDGVYLPSRRGGAINTFGQGYLKPKLLRNLSPKDWEIKEGQLCAFGGNTAVHLRPNLAIKGFRDWRALLKLRTTVSSK